MISTQEEDSESRGELISHSAVEPSYILPTPEQKVHNAALFVLKTREVLNILETATSQILQDVTNVFRQSFSEMESKLSDILSSNCVQPDILQGFKEVFQDPDPFVNLHSKYVQDMYFSEKMGLVVCYI